MPEKIGIGIIGCGGISGTHIRIYSQWADIVRVVAVCDVVPERAKARRETVRQEYLKRAQDFDERAEAASCIEAEQFKALAAACREAADENVSFHTSPEDLVKDDRVQAVSICTPPFAHAAPMIAVAKAGRHVFCEGPMAGTLHECDEMLAAARENGIKFTVQYGHTRFTRSAMMAKRAVETGMLGRLVAGKVDVLWYRKQSYYDHDPWRGTWAGERGGATFHHGRYAIDLYLWLMGLVDEVYARMGTFTHSIEVEDCSVAVVRFQNGALGHVMATTSAHPNPQVPSQRIEIWGELASLVALPGFEIGSAEEGYADKVKAQLEQEVPPLPYEGMTGQMWDFIQAILEDREPLITAESTRAQVEFTRAVYKSAATGQPVKLPLWKYDPYY